MKTCAWAVGAWFRTYGRGFGWCQGEVAVQKRLHELLDVDRASSPSSILSSLEMSDTQVYEPKIRALLGTASHICELHHSHHHARPFVGVFQKSISMKFIHFWRYFPHKNEEMAPRTRTGYPHEGPCVGRLVLLR